MPTWRGLIGAEEEGVEWVRSSASRCKTRTGRHDDDPTDGGSSAAAASCSSGRVRISTRPVGSDERTCVGTSVLKRLFVHAGAFNLGLWMRTLFGVGTPRSLQGCPAAIVTLLIVMWTVIDAP